MRDVLDELNPTDEAQVSSCSRAARELLKLLGPLTIIEIGTSYGRQLPEYSGSVRLTCIDPMYDWVPDVTEEQGFDPGLTDEAKYQEWRRNLDASGCRPVTLIFGNSYQVHADERWHKELDGTQLLIIDGCHHPAELVLKDYTNYRKFLTLPHYVVWDDIGEGDVKQACHLAENEIRGLGLDMRHRDFNNCRIFYVFKPD